MKNPLHFSIAPIFVLIAFSFCVPPMCAATDTEIFAMPAASTAASAPSNGVALDVKLSTGINHINAFTGTLSYPTDKLTAQEIYEGDSIISFWVKPPTIDQKSGTISFQGTSVGGISADNGQLFKIIFVPKAVKPEEQKVPLVWQNLKAYLNDGHGTVVPMIGRLVTVALPAEAVSAKDSSTTTVAEDAVPPEPFTLSVAHYPQMYEGAWFLVFSARDNQSGIARYEIQEVRNPTPLDNAWSEATSPYVLRDQSRQSYIYVRATDKFGNARVVSLAPENGGEKIYTNYLFWCILVLILGIGVVLWIFRVTNHKRIHSP